MRYDLAAIHSAYIRGRAGGNPHGNCGKLICIEFEQRSRHPGPQNMFSLQHGS